MNGNEMKQRRFIDEYMIDCDSAAAARRAGYAHKSAGVQGARLMAIPYIREEIERRQAALSAKHAVTVDAVVTELAKLGFANMKDYMKVGPDGDPVLDFSQLTRDQAAALAEVTVEDFVDGRGDDARDVKRVKFKLADKRAALVDLGKHLGMFKQEISVTVDHNVQRVLGDMTPAEAMIAYEQTLLAPPEALDAIGQIEAEDAETETETETAE